MRACDFCGGARASWAFRARPIRTSRMLVDETNGQPFVFDFVDTTGVWAACSACRRLINNGERDKLLRRAVTPCDVVLAERVPSQAVAYVRELQDDFWRSREGPAVPIESVVSSND